MTSPSPGPSPNTDTYLSHLSPAGIRHFEITRNVALVTLGVIIWDILVYLPEDLWIVRNNRFRSVIFSFIFSRLSAVGFILCSTISKTMSVEKPRALSITAGCMCSLSLICSSFLFLRRVHAVYADNKSVRWCFSVLWVIAAGSTTTIPASMKTVYIPGTHYFYDFAAKSYIVLSAICPLLFDSCVFLAISYRIATTHNASDERIGWATLVSGRALPRLSRAVLQGGQQYYLVVLVTIILSAVAAFVPSIPGPLKSVFTVPGTFVTASMACRVFRNIMLFDLRNTPTDLISEVVFVEV